MTVSAVDHRRGNLPADLTTFVGRRQELADVKIRLSSSRLVTLTGLGGVGKTRLALRVAWSLRRNFRDGVWLVELAGLRDPGLVGQTLAASLGLHDHSTSRYLEWLLDQLADREMLIVLDNCEHLLDAAAGLANSLLRACPSVRILATSRQALGMEGERLMTLSPLSAPPDSVPTFAEGLLRYEAVALFLERATAVQPDFKIDPANQSAVAAICRRLDGIPLAIELAASRLRGLSLDELLARLDDRYALLTGGRRAALPRQQSLRALVDWSFELCSEPERVVWARLSTFAGGFELEAAELVCSDDAVPPDAVWDIVTRLVDKSIVVASDEAGTVRYGLTATLREYGRDRLDEFGETARLRTRHRDWARQLIARFDAGWFGAEQVPMLRRLRREHANLREVLTFCLDSPVEAGIGLEMVAALRFYWVVSGRVTEGRHWLDQLLTACEDRGPTRIKALCVAGYLATMGNDFAAAQSLLDEARVLATRLADKAYPALVIQVEALIALFQGKPEQARPLLQKALDSHREIGDESAATYDQAVFALCIALLGDSETAVIMLEECLDATHAHGEHWLRALTLWALGIERCKQGDYQGATSAELESLRLRLTLDDRSTMGMNLQVLAWTAAATGDAERAARLTGASEQLAQSVGLSLEALGHLRDLQHSYDGIGRHTVSDSRFGRAYEEGRRLTFDEVVELASGERPGTTEPTSQVATAPALGRLTKRETEIAGLVSRGLSNKEIAAALVISQRTAETHVEHILTKLGFTSRTQVAAWVIEGSGE